MNVDFGMPLEDYPHIFVRLSCYKCGRHERHVLARLASEFGCEITLFDLLGHILDCPRFSKTDPHSDDSCEVTFPSPFYDQFVGRKIWNPRIVK